MARKEFFDWKGPSSKGVEIGSAVFDIPIFYYRDDLFLGFFTGNYKKIRELLPSSKLQPIQIIPGRAMVGIMGFNYIETSIGPYGEIGMGIPVVFDATIIPVLPLLLESYYPRFGFFVIHLPVTTIRARDAGIGVWGYPKFIADMHFVSKPEAQSVTMYEEKQHILTLTVRNRGFLIRDNRHLITFSEKDGNLISTKIPMRAIYRSCIRRGTATLELGNHPVADTLREMDVSLKSVISRNYIERCAILPKGVTIGHCEKKHERYIGREIERGDHITTYI